MKRRKPTTMTPGRFSAEDVATILCDPIYSYGQFLQPQNVVIDAVVALDEQFAEQFEASGQLPGLDELDRAFTTLLDELVARGTCRLVQVVPAIISKEEWLRVQLVTIRRMAQGKKLSIQK